MTLHEFLEKNEMTEAEFAAKIGKNQTTVGRYKRLEHFPSVKMILKIERVTDGKVKYKDWVQ